MSRTNAADELGQVVPIAKHEAGFEIMDEAQLASGGASMWTLWREGSDR